MAAAPSSASELCRELLDQGPGARDVPLRGVEIADRQPQRIAAVEPGVGQEDLAGGIQPLEQRAR